MSIPGAAPGSKFPGRDKCGDCGGLYYTDEMYLIDAAGTLLCETCLKTTIEKEREAIAERKQINERQGGYEA